MLRRKLAQFTVCVLASVLAYTSAEADEGETELRDLSDLDTVSLGEAKVSSPRLKEAAQISNNPNCQPANYPSCLHGSTVDTNKCTCKNGGKMDTSLCECKCTPGFSGKDCAKGSKCLNGGTAQGDACKCPNAWSGPTCTQCNLSCKNGGKPNKKNCVCSCKSPFQPPTCAECKNPGCKNGGKWAAAACKCECSKTNAFTGVNCGTCADPKCVNGRFNKAGCKCKCNHEGWRGPRCNECERVCSGGKTVNPKTCECEQTQKVSYNPCETGCKHGTLDKDKCKCSCDKGWKGIFCDECENDKCYNEGAHDGNTCECKCVGPWVGENCKECATKCVNGDLKANCGGCDCNPVAAGSWKGYTCNKCEHKPCLNGGTLDSNSCTCRCRMGYSGPTCAACTLSQASCKNDSVFRPATCDCDCTNVVGDWSGRLCGTCNHKGCMNEGEVDKKICMCKCVPMWKGRYCDTCGHEFCQAKPAKWILGQDGFTDKKSKPECAWVRDLGCPGGLN